MGRRGREKRGGRGGVDTQMFTIPLRRSPFVRAGRQVEMYGQSTGYETVDHAVDKFIGPYWGDKVDYGIGLSYRPATLCSLMVQYNNPMPLSTLSRQSGTMNWAPVLSYNVAPASESPLYVNL